MDTVESNKVARAEKLRNDGIEVAELDDPEYNSPNTGGCWICRKGNGMGNDDMEFDMELDTFYHQDCLDQTGCESILEYERGY